MTVNRACAWETAERNPAFEWEKPHVNFHFPENLREIAGEFLFLHLRVGTQQSTAPPVVMKRKSATQGVRAGQNQVPGGDGGRGESLFAVSILPSVATGSQLKETYFRWALMLPSLFGDCPYARDECNLAYTIRFHLPWSLTSPFQ